MKILRPYQREGVDATWSFLENSTGNGLVVIPTGGGKSLMLGTTIYEALQFVPDARILCITHVKELIAQNFKELVDFWPGAPAGIYSAGLGKRQISSQVLFAGIASIFSKAIRLQKIDIILVDECDMIPRDANTMYRRLLSDLLQINPELRIIGYTATPFRTTSGYVYGNEGDIFDSLIYEINIRDLIEQGWLVPPVTVRGVDQMDVSGVKKGANGEFVAGQLEAVATDPATVKRHCGEVLEHWPGRHGLLHFACGKSHAEMILSELRRGGLQVEVVFGDTPSAERDRHIVAIKQRRLDGLVSIGVLTTGVNIPHADIIAIDRATASLRLMHQIIGRGTRCVGNNIHDSIRNGKADCLVLDYGNNIDRHGPVDNPIVPFKKPKKKGPISSKNAAYKPCVNLYCGEPCPAAARECKACGSPFPDPESKVSIEASNASILSTRDYLAPEWISVDKVQYSRHIGKSGIPTLKVTYFCGLMTYSEYICFEHSGMPRRKAEVWYCWRRSGEHIYCPISVDEILSQTKKFRQPTAIAVRPVAGTKFHDILDYQLDKQDALSDMPA